MATLKYLWFNIYYFISASPQFYENNSSWVDYNSISISKCKKKMTGWQPLLFSSELSRISTFLLNILTDIPPNKALLSWCRGTPPQPPRHLSGSRLSVFVHFSRPCWSLLHTSHHAASVLKNLWILKWPSHQVQTPLPSLQGSLCHALPSLSSRTSPRHPTQLGPGRQVKSQFSTHATSGPLWFCSYASFPICRHLFPSFSQVNPHSISTITSCLGPDGLSNTPAGLPVPSLAPLSSFTRQPKSSS